jgi:predicted transcriptional regulator of viral defense system
MPNAPVSEHHDLVAAMARTNKAVVVLLSALRFHELGTQQPNEVWIQLPLKARVPRMDWPTLKVIRTRIDALFTEGVERHTISGVEIRITDPARTVVDCFKHRNQIGLDVCLEALKELLQRDRSVIDRIYHYAKLNRVQRVMQPGVNDSDGQKVRKETLVGFWGYLSGLKARKHKAQGFKPWDLMGYDPGLKGR